jgi:2-dehydro-3-deoxygluconokinase
MIQRWQEERINTDLVLQDASRQQGLYVIQLDQYGERTFLYWGNQSAARYLHQHPEFDTIKQNLLLIDRVCLSGITVAILPAEDRLKLIVLLNELSANGVQIAFDTNFRPALWPQEAERMTVKSDYQPICLCVILHWLPLMMSKLCG